MLAASNGLVIVIALALDWTLVSMMLVYWTQSVVIGVSNVCRILALERFSTENFTINKRPVDPTPQTKRQVATFFMLHYGIFHFAYLVFIVTEAGDEPLFDAGFLVCAAAFALNHLYSYRYNRDLDRRGRPNIGTLMFTPYLRIIPMHLTIVFGLSRAHGSLGLLFFGGLKTAADVLMHYVEHLRLQRPAGA